MTDKKTPSPAPTFMRAIKGNSVAAMAGRAAAMVRRNNAWKVREGFLTRRDLARWARQVEARCKEAPENFAGWHGVVRKERVINTWLT
jgi:hypothetical protein